MLMLVFLLVLVVFLGALLVRSLGPEE